MTSIYYVYFHICRSTGRTFYIGKGKGKRAYETNSRSIKWKAYVSENGYDVFIYKSGLTEDDAYKLENQLIILHKEHGFLTNIAGVVTSYSIAQKSNGLTKSQQLKQTIAARLAKENLDKLRENRKEQQIIERTPLRTELTLQEKYERQRMTKEWLREIDEEKIEYMRNLFQPRTIDLEIQQERYDDQQRQIQEQLSC